MIFKPLHPDDEDQERLASLLPVPADRELVEGRSDILREYLMSEIQEQAVPRRGTRRLAVAGALAAVAVAAVTAFAVARPGAPASNAEVHMHLAAWSVDTNPDKTVTVTLRELSDPQKLSAILAKAGVRAKVQFLQLPDGSPGSGCYKQGPHRMPSDRVISFPRDVDGAEELTITPAAMPRGSVLSFVVFGGQGGQVDSTYITLFDGEPDPCVPLPPGYHD